MSRRPEPTGNKVDELKEGACDALLLIERASCATGVSDDNDCNGDGDGEGDGEGVEEEEGEGDEDGVGVQWEMMETRKKMNKKLSFMRLI